MEENNYKKLFSRRLNKIIGFYGLNPHAFEAQCELKLGVIQKAITNEGSISAEAISKIILAFNEISATWLLTGEGSMFVEQTKSNQRELEEAQQALRDKEMDMKGLRKLVADLEKQLDNQSKSIKQPKSATV